MFECFAFKHVPKELIIKLDLKAQHIMVFVGYAKNSKVVSYGTKKEENYHCHKCGLQ
jgi:hypothetical protein